MFPIIGVSLTAAALSGGLVSRDDARRLASDQRTKAAFAQYEAAVLGVEDTLARSDATEARVRAHQAARPAKYDTPERAAANARYDASVRQVRAAIADAKATLARIRASDAAREAERKASPPPKKL